MAFRIKDGFTVGTTDIVNSSGQVLVYQKDTTTIGQNLSKIPDITVDSFIRLNADETVSALDAATFRTAIGAGSGSVTSVGLTMPGIFSVAGSPITGSGSFTVTYANQATNTVFAGPNGSTGAPTFRALAAADIPALSYLSNATNSTQDGYFGDVYLRDDTNPSHYLQITNAQDLTAARTLSISTGDASRTITFGGNLSLANNFTTSGNFALTLTTTAATNVTLPTTGTLAATDQSFFFGTTSIAINRASADLAVAGITTITGRTGGTFTLESPTAATGNSQNIVIQTGTATQAAAVNSGNINISTGNVSDALGLAAGSITVQPGTGGGAGTGAALNLQGGSLGRTAIAAGSVAIVGGAHTVTGGTAVGGDITLKGGSTSSTNAFTKNTGSVYIDGGGSGAGGTITYGSVFIGNMANGTSQGTTHVTLGKSGTEVRLPGVGTSGFVKLGANGALSADTVNYLATTGGNISGSLTVGGDLTVNGTLTSINSNTVTVNDKNIELASIEAVTSLGATLVGATNSVTLTSGSTNTLIVGQRLNKTGQTGVFGGTTASSTGLTVNLTVSGNIITVANVNSGGTLYSVGDTIQVTGYTTGGALLTVASTNGVTGVVTGLTITNAGSGLTNGTPTGVATTVQTSAGPWIASISSSTVFTTNVNHNTAGWIVFDAQGTTTDITANGGGISLKGTTDKTIIWDNTNSNWTSSEHWNIATGKTFKINNTTVLSNTQVLGRTPGGSTAGDIATIDASQTLTNKTITFGGNTISGTTAQFNAALTDDDFATLTNTVTLTNKTFTDSTTTFQDDADNTKKMQFQLSGISASTTRTLTVPNVSDTLAVIGTAQTFTAAQTFRAASSVRAEAAATQDAVILAGRAGGTGSFAVTLTPTTLSANRTVTLADGNVTMVSGTMAVLGTAQTFTAAQTFRAASSVRAEAAATQDAVILAGRAGGTGSFGVSLTPTTLTANRTLTLPDLTGTVLSSGNEIIRLGGDTSTAEIARSRGIEILYDGRSATPRRLVGAGTTTASITLSQAIANWGIGDLVTVSGATSTEGTKTNGTWRVSGITGESLTVSYATNGANPSTITGTITGSDPNHQTGDQITISGATPTALNGTWTITRTGTTTFTFNAGVQIASITASGTTRVPTIRFVVGSTVTAGSYIAATDLGSINISKVAAIAIDQSGDITFVRYSNNTSGVFSADSSSGRGNGLANVSGSQGIFSSINQNDLSGSGGTYLNSTNTIVRGGDATDSSAEAFGGNVIIRGGTGTVTGGTLTTAIGGDVSINGGSATGANTNTFGNVNIGTVNTTTINIGSSTNNLYVPAPTTIYNGLSFSINNTTERINVRTIASTTIASAAEAIMDSWSATNYRSASYIVQVTQTGSPAPEYYSSKIGILHDGTTPTMTEYEVLETGSIPITFTSDISGGNVRLKVTLTDGATRNATVVLHRTLVRV